MSFNPDPSKQAVEVYFTRRLIQANVPVISFNNTDITSSEYQKHLRKYVPRQSLITL